MKRTHYEILQVARDAPAEVIAAAYRAQMVLLRKHPDLGGDEEEAIAINEAHEVLSDPERRAAYDAALPARPSSGTGSDGAAEERRRAPRFSIDAQVSFCKDHDQRWHTARITDYSSLGMRLRSHDPLEVGGHLVIVPPNIASFAIHGTVRWARVFHPSIFERVFEAGVEFAHQVEDIEKRLVL